MKLQLAQRQQVKIKLALQGPAGSGKSYSDLLLAYGLCHDWSKVAVIDTENHSCALYSHLGGFSVLNISSPFTPEKYIEAINLCVEAGIEVIIIDSLSHEWDGPGGCLQIHNEMAGNSFTNWGKVTPRHNAFVHSILQSPVHIIGTIRSKQDYIITEKKGKQVPEKVGLKGITKEGFDYEFTLLFEINCKHFAVASKDRTGLYMDQPEFKITPSVGEVIYNWCMQGEEAKPLDITEIISDCKTIGELLKIYDMYPQVREQYLPEFSKKKVDLQGVSTSDLLTQKTVLNGTSSHK